MGQRRAGRLLAFATGAPRGLGEPTASSPGLPQAQPRLWCAAPTLTHLRRCCSP